MNKKGFTLVELILTMAVVMIIMATITSVTYTYREQSSYENIITEVTTYKNNVTKIIYDDILDIRKTGESKGKVIKIEKENNYKYTLTTDKNNKNNLEIIDNTNKVGIKYGPINEEIEYIIPGSNNNLISFDSAVLEPSGTESNIYKLDIYFNHKNLDDKIKIHLIVSK